MTECGAFNQKQMLLEDPSLINYIKSSRNGRTSDPVARVISYTSLVIGIISLIAAFGISPWAYFQASSAIRELNHKADVNVVNDMEDEVSNLRQKVTSLQGELEKSRNVKQNDLFEARLGSNTSLNRSKRQAGDKKKALRFENNDYGGTTYIRWGRTDCRVGADTLYKGVAAGGYYKHAGGGADYQCLPVEPQFGYVNPGNQYSAGIGGSSIWGVEFKLQNIDPFDNKFNKGKSMNLEDATCAACYAPGRSTTIMIPARTECPLSWTLEYKGYLMAPHFKQHRMTYACVDEAPQPRESGKNTNGGLYWYAVEVQCGAIPCPQYVNGHEVSCVVCSK